VSEPVTGVNLIGVPTAAVVLLAPKPGGGKKNLQQSSYIQ
jgi:hypothetical protein